MRVAFDLDNVVVDILASARMKAAARAGIDARDVLDTHVYAAPFTHPDPSVAALVATDHDFWQDLGMLRAATPMPGAIAALRALAQVDALGAYVTRRAPNAREVTLDWLQRVGAPEAELAMVGHEDADHNHAACKADVCLMLGMTHLVDDSEGEAERAMRRGVSPILVDHPLGRARRTEWLARHPGIPLARDAAHAVQMLTAGAASG